MDSPPVLVSACLAGLPCRWDGGATPCDRVLELVRRGRALPVCPEQLGGLPTPREPCEIVGGRVVGRYGTDHTAAFERGARAALALALEAGCREAVLKARSPSCGSGTIYDGTFTGVATKGDGVFARLLLDNGIMVLHEEEIGKSKIMMEQGK